jgi:Sulfotransferase family
MTFLSKFDEFHQQAIEIAGCDDFGTPNYVEPMKILLQDYDRGYLGDIGTQMNVGHIVALLVSRLFAQKGFKDHPDYVAAAIEKPIIIVGMPRTGSTALHRLLAQDSGCQYLTPWLGNTPMPSPPRESWEDNPWYQMTAEGFRQFYQLIPQVRGIHPQGAAEADECRYGIEPGFWSPALAFCGAVNEYAEWVVNDDAKDSYQHYRKVLALISAGDKRRWILKDPTTHSWVPETLMETFPDACYVFTHRNPVKSLASAANMMFTSRKVWQPDLTPAQNSKEQLALWCPAIEKLERAMAELPASRVCHVHNDELHRDPVGTAQQIYRYFGIPVTDAATAAWQALVDDDPRGGHGDHRYTPEENGITEADVRDRMPLYCKSYEHRYGMET